jgi:DNA-binding transcriptional regulator YhcF (GntR family)
MHEEEQARKEYEKELADLLAKIKEGGFTDEEILALPKEIFAELKRRDLLN